MYNYFKDNYPRVSQDGANFVSDSAQNLSALRDAIASGNLYGWNYTNGALNGLGTYSQPSRISYSKDVNNVQSEIRGDITSWSAYGAAVINWTFISYGVTLIIGTETTTWDSSGNCTGSTWSGTATVELFDHLGPRNLDHVLLTVDVARENLMSVRDECISGVAGVGYAYSKTTGTGTASQPQYLVWSTGTYRMRADITYASNGSVTAILWQTSDNSGSNWKRVGTESYIYDSSFNCTQVNWSATGAGDAYTQFENNRPIISEADALDIVRDIRNNVNALHDGAVIRAMPFWNYFLF